MRKIAAALVMLGAVLTGAPAHADLTGKAAPDAELKATWNAMGEQALKDFKGRVVLLEVFATW